MKTIITGGSRGIGLAIARALPGEVGVVSRTEAPGVPWEPADVADRAAVNAALDRLHGRLGGTDALVVCAGHTEHVPAGGDDEAWNRVIAANLTGAYHAATWAAPKLPRPGGRIVAISSIAAYSGGSAGGAIAYSAAKAGVLGLTRALARELAPQGIAVNAIAPGLIAGTGFFGPGDQQPRIDAATPQIPAGCPGTPEDVADAVKYLLAADYVHGQVLHVNGGWYFGG
jgi:3-oxoacyl-[acyl-carrier protein] reductase